MKGRLSGNQKKSPHLTSNLPAPDLGLLSLHNGEEYISVISTPCQREFLSQIFTSLSIVSDRYVIAVMLSFNFADTLCYKYKHELPGGHFY